MQLFNSERLNITSISDLTTEDLTSVGEIYIELDDILIVCLGKNGNNPLETCYVVYDVVDEDTMLVIHMGSYSDTTLLIDFINKYTDQ